VNDQIPCASAQQFIKTLLDDLRYFVVQELIGLQRYPFPFEVNRDLVNTLRVSLYLNYSEEEIYQLSVVREPREIKHSTSSAVSK